MRYSQEYKLECIELYRQGIWPETPPGISEKNFRITVRRWVRLEEANGSDSLKHNPFDKNWTPEPTALTRILIKYYYITNVFMLLLLLISFLYN